jgi:hypothetical protein
MAFRDSPMLAPDRFRELLPFLGKDIPVSLFLHDTAGDEPIHGPLRDPRDDPVFFRDATNVGLARDELIEDDPSEFIRKNESFVHDRTNSLI